MRGIIIASALAGAAFLALPMEAEAARCKQGKIYRPSLGICMGKQTAARQGVRVRHAKASIRHRYKRPPVKRASNVQKMQIAPAVVAYPPPRPVWERPRVDPVPRPEWLAGVDLFDNALAWANRGNFHE